MAESGTSEHPRRIGGYELLSVAGRGAMGVVYKARQVSMDRIVALKVLSASLAQDQTYVQRFLREARIAGACTHPNLLRVMDVGQIDGFYCYSMEFVGGPTLKRVVLDHGPIAEGLAIQYLIKVAGALAEVHRKGIVHRDVKPDNILLTERGDPRLADLGLAKPMGGDSSLTIGGAVIGTPHYMAPEQAGGSEIDRRADLYSLGATFFFALTGRTLFEGASGAEVMARHATEPAPRLRDVNPDASAGLEAVLVKLLERAAADRYQDAESLVDDLEAIAAGRLPKLARIQSSSTRTPRGSGHSTAQSSARHRRVPQPEADPSGTTARVKAVVAAGAGLAVLAVGLTLALVPDASPPGRASRPAPTVPAGGAVAVPAQAVASTPTTQPASTPTTQPASAPAVQPADAPPVAHLGESLDELLARTGSLAEADEYDAAIAELERAAESPGEDRRSAIRGEADVLRAAAINRIRAALARAEDAAALGDTVAARSALASARGVRYVIGLGQETPRIAELERLIAQTQARPRAVPVAPAPLVPVPSAAASAAPGGGQVQDALDEFDRLLATRDYAGALACVRQSAKRPELASGVDAFGAAERLAGLLIERRAAMRSALEAELGERVSLWTVKGQRTGTLEKVDDAGALVATQSVINGRVVGVSRSVVTFNELTAAEHERLAKSWRPGLVDREIVQAVSAALSGDAEAAASALVRLGPHPLAAHYTEVLRKGRAAARENAARQAWADLKKTLDQKRFAAAAERTVLADLESFVREHDGTAFVATVAGEIAAARSRAEVFLGPVLRLTGYWTFDEARGAVAVDATQARNDAALVGATWAAGVFGGALAVSGTGHAFLARAGAYEMGSSDFTLAAWVSAEQSGPVVVKAPEDGGWPVRAKALIVLRGRFAFDSSGTGTSGLQGGPVVVGTGWHHVAVTYTAAARAVRLSVDGVSAGSAIIPLAADDPSHVIRVGHAPGNTPFGGFGGMVDDLRFYDRALDETEIARLHDLDGHALAARQALRAALRVTFKAEKSMKLYPAGFRNTRFPAMEHADATLPFFGAPAYFDQRTGQDVQYDVRAAASVRVLRVRMVAMRNMTIHVFDAANQTLGTTGPHRGGNDWGEFEVAIKPSTQFTVCIHNEGSRWLLIDRIWFE